MTEEVKPSKSIVDPKYKNMRGASDWVGELLEREAKVETKAAVAAVAEVKDADGKVITKAKRAVAAQSRFDVNRLFIVAENNGVDTTKYTGAPASRMRMTISNLLRARAKRRGGLFDGNGKWLDAPAGYADEITETRDGQKIAKPKAEKATQADTGDSEETPKVAPKAATVVKAAAPAQKMAIRR